MLCYRCRKNPAQINDGDDAMGEPVCCDCYSEIPQVMRIAVLSDLHLDFHRDDGREFIARLNPAGVDVLVLAGDFTNGHLLNEAAQLLCRKYKHVVYVYGNHELYDHHVKQAPGLLRNPPANLHHLERDTVTIDGVRFVGTTLWFPRPDTQIVKNSYNDFHWIHGFEPWVYEQHRDSVEFLARTLRTDDVLVTHFMPLRESIAPDYAGHPLNCFFWSGETADRIVRECSPRLVLHGHTHASLDYDLGDSRVVCNPFGYVVVEENRSFNTRKMVVCAR